MRRWLRSVVVPPVTATLIVLVILASLTGNVLTAFGLLCN